MKTEMDDIRIFLDTTQKTGLHPELGWKRLPMQEEEVARILETTGIEPPGVTLLLLAIGKLSADFSTIWLLYHGCQLL